MEEIIKTGLTELGIAAPPETLPRLRKYYELLRERGGVMNLTAITGEEDTARLHFLDCIALLGLYDMKGKSLIDVGAGAGFPGLPLKIAEPSLRVTLLDSLGKRVDFLSECRDALDLPEVTLVCARAEEAAESLRESFDIAASRAVARLNVLCELCMPFVRPGGVFIAMKGPGAEEELLEAKRAISELGGRCVEIKTYTVPGTNAAHAAVIIEKTEPTPAKYPRRWAKMTKQPL